MNGNEFINNFKEGYGAMSQLSDAIYKGCWKHGQTHGAGKYKNDS